MKTHLNNKSSSAKPTNHLSTLRVWCGREVKRIHATDRLAAVECDKCRAAFAAELAKLPNAFQVDA